LPSAGQRIAAALHGLRLGQRHGAWATVAARIAKRLNRDPSGAPNGPAPDLIIFGFFVFSHARVRPLT